MDGTDLQEGSGHKYDRSPLLPSAKQERTLLLSTQGRECEVLVRRVCEES